MAKIVIVYWSGPGNTEMIARAIKEGMESKGADVVLRSVDEASPEEVKEAKCIVFDSPLMRNR